VDDISNAAAEAVANTIAGTLAISHAYGRLQFDADLDLHFRTLIGTGRNPNVAAVVMIGIEPKWTQPVVDGIAATRKPVDGFSIETYGDLKTIERASRVAAQLVKDATERQRERCTIDELCVSTKCGQNETTTVLGSCPTVGNVIDKLDPLGITSCFGETSELTGAEEVCASRAASDEVRAKFMATWRADNDMITRHKTNDLSEGQPPAGTIAGGLTKISENVFGSQQKIGKKTQFSDVLIPAEEPQKGPGPLLHGHLLGSRRMRDPPGGRRLRRASVPNR
jgi:(2R)-sulfolactate sulfo-lyase subunit beta